MKKLTTYLYYSLQILAIAGTLYAVAGCKSEPSKTLQSPQSGIVVTLDGKKYTASGDISLSPFGVVDTVKPTEPPITDKVSGLVGTNCHPWNPLDKLRSFNLRTYVDAAWVWTEKGLYISPMKQAKAQTAFGMLDDYFNQCARLGIDCMPCVLRTPDWLNGKSENNGTNSNQYPPIRPGKNRLDIASYAEYAEFWAQLAMRYGTRAFPDNQLRVDVTPRWNNDIPNIKRSGLGSLPIDQGGVRIKWFEINNEVMPWWNRGGDKDGTYMTPEEAATMTLACYRAIKKVSDIKVIMGGTTGLELDYIKAMYAHVQKIAPGEKFTDAINVHFYTNTGNEYAKHPPMWLLSGACYPENDKGFPYLKEIVKFAKEKGVKVWLSEFGADSDPPSWMNIKVEGVSDKQAQGELIVRTFKMCAQYGVERAYVFTACDESGGTGLWQRCGMLTSEITGYQYKPAYSAVLKYIEETGKPSLVSRSIKKPETSGTYFKQAMK